MRCCGRRRPALATSPTNTGRTALRTASSHTWRAGLRVRKCMSSGRRWSVCGHDWQTPSSKIHPHIEYQQHFDLSQLHLCSLLVAVL